MTFRRVSDAAGTLSNTDVGDMGLASDQSRQAPRPPRSPGRTGRLLRNLAEPGARRLRRLIVRKARAVRACVLDGSTLWVSGELRSMHLRAPGTTSLELWLRRRGAEALRLCAAEVTRRRRRGVSFEASPSLVAAGGHPMIGPGDWDVYLGVPGRRLLRIRAPRLEPDAGPTLLNPRSPETGMRYRLRATSLGQLSVQVTAFPPHAEVEEVRHEPTELAVAGRFVALTLPDGSEELPVELEFSERGTGEVLAVPARVCGGRFRAQADPDRFADPHGGHRVWEMALRVPGAEPLVLGRYLDDLRDPRSAYRYPRVVVGSGSGNATAMQVGYTGDRRLALFCDPAVGEDLHA